MATIAIPPTLSSNALFELGSSTVAFGDIPYLWTEALDVAMSLPNPFAAAIDNATSTEEHTPQYQSVPHLPCVVY